ncbi:hypothetical protein ACLB2K_012830 [Fragaria x ananassa]
MTVTFLDDSAYHWWTLASKNNGGAQDMTWEQFKTLFWIGLGGAGPVGLILLDWTMQVRLCFRRRARGGGVVGAAATEWSSVAKSVVQSLGWRQCRRSQSKSSTVDLALESSTSAVVRFKAGSVEPAHHHTFGHNLVVIEGGGGYLSPGRADR